MFPADEWFGKIPEETFPPEIAESMRKNDLKALSEGLVTYEEDWSDKDGCLRVLETKKFSIDQKDNAPFLGVIITDITDRKRAVEAMRESEELYRTIFENTGTSMILIEEDMTISMANAEFVRNTEYSPDEINGRMKWTEIVHPDDLGPMVEQHRLRREIQGGALPSYEFRYITKTGHVMDTFLTIKLVPGTKKSIASLINITERKKAEDKLQQTLESLRKAIGTTIQVLVSAVESRDSYTAGHQSRSADLACAIATEMGLAQEKIEGIRMAGIIHDIGKLSIPAEILSKPTKLTEIEFALIKEHSRSGYEMLKDVESPWPLAEIVYQHHERMNGSGYPRNLKGNEIILESKILAVADVVEAMASHRPYRPTLGIKAALEEIEKNRSILYDNAVADACLKLFREKGYQLT
jgi:PAS domain S-box-containing protein